MSIITTPVALALLRRNQDPLAIPGSLAWAPGDPLQVLLTMRPNGRSMTWWVGRDLLMAGLTSRAGDGDIRIQPYRAAEHRLRIDLRTDKGAASLTVAAEPVAAFLARTWAALPKNREAAAVTAALDTELARLWEAQP